MEAEGWYRDPYGVHGDRWFSAGRPTELVRDGDLESHDEPPAVTPPTPSIEVPAKQSTAGADLRRADEDDGRGQSGTSSMSRQVIDDAAGWIVME